MKLANPILTSEEAVVDLLFHLTILIEYQMIDIQAGTKRVVTEMSSSTYEIDRIANEYQTRAKELLEKEADSLDPKVKELVEYFSKIGDAILPKIFSLVEGLNNEDVISQKIDHLLNGYRFANEGVAEFLNLGINNFTKEDVQVFCDLVKKTIYSSYTMNEERDIFDQVFLNKKVV